MPGFIPALDSDSLAALRRLVASMNAQNGKALPIPELVKLADQVQTKNGLTIDFQATADLGSPMVVVQVPQQHQHTLPSADLSKREQEVAGLIAQGLSNKQIAKRLHISQATVKDHVHHILTKTGLPNRTAIAVAIQSANSKS
jgi:DNA-binding NarL/FixJ family response regulator